MFPNANAKTLLAIVSCALVVQAQSSASNTTTAPASQSSVPTLDACIIGCLTIATAASNCTSYTDVSCVCTSTAFQSAAQGCLQANCTTADIAAAEALQGTECGSLSSSSGAVSTAASTGTSAAATGTSASASASASATSKSAAMALSAPFSFGSLFGTLVASAGVLVGAAIVL